MSQSQFSITVNDSSRIVPNGITVEGLLDLLGLKPRFLAVELNRRVVPRSDHRQTVLSEGDCIEIVTLVGGG
ncbi:MAG TPA: sulfur carrier protein ThiS [Schlesneria sp.]|jgi:thiamine biosynthesis protein ThiS